MRALRTTAVLFTITASVAGAQSTQDHAKHQAAQKHDMGKMDHMAAWKEMDAFHVLLAATFHPVKEKQDLKPLREKADQLAAAARAWAGSTAPASCDTEEVRTTVATLSTDALAIGNQVLAKATDAELTRGITALHDKFEVVEKKCGGHDMKGMKH